MRFYNPDSGEIVIDGNAIQTLDINWLRNNVTLVQQESVLFNETVFKNIAFGIRNPERINNEDIRTAIELAMLQDTIRNLPQSLDTVVGSGGNAMSGGQRQRVAIARARLRDTPILILDEATSALDPTSKLRVMDAIRIWRQRKTTIIITHDMSQIREADFAYVLDNGAVIQEGHRHTLKNLGGGPLGPFNRRGKRPVDKQLPNLPEKAEQFKSPTSKSSSRPSSIRSRDSMDIQFRPKKKTILSVLTPRLEDLTHGLRSPVLSPPLSPAIFPLSRMSTAHTMSLSSKRSPPQPIGAAYHSTPKVPLPNEIEMIEMGAINHGLGISYSPNLSTEQPGSTVPNYPPTPRSPRNIEPPVPKNISEIARVEETATVVSIKTILSTVWPALTWRKRIILVCGFACAAIHAGATPAFSWVFSKLLATFFSSRNRSQESIKWSLSVLGVALLDASASYCMHYLLEYCGQAWVDTLRIKAIKCILDQPRSWFDGDNNRLTTLTECLDRNTEEMRNLLGRFAGFVFVAVTMVVIAVIWSLVVSWKLTLVGLASGPFMYGVTRSFEAVSGKWEKSSNDAGEVANSIFMETFGNIRTVRALTLENYFHEKYSHATERARIIGLKRSMYSGFFFGLSDSCIIFVTGEHFFAPSINHFILRSLQR